MIRVCIICGKEFEGRYNASVCSGVCRIEYQRRYQQQYKQKNKDYIQNYNKRWYAMHNNKPLPKKVSKEDIIANIVTLKVREPKKVMPDIYKGSSWGKRYWKADRLDRIVYLSSALSKHGLSYLTYGQLSAIYEEKKYMDLLYKVLLLEEVQSHEADSQIR